MAVPDSVITDMPSSFKSTGFPLPTSRQHDNFYSTLERLRAETTPCPPIEEEKRPWDTDLEASYFPPMFPQPAKSAQPLLGWRKNSYKLELMDYSQFDEKDDLHWKACEPGWHRRSRSSGWMALFFLLLIVIYLSLFKI